MNEVLDNLKKKFGILIAASAVSGKCGSRQKKCKKMLLENEPSGRGGQTVTRRGNPAKLCQPHRFKPNWSDCRDYHPEKSWNGCILKELDGGGQCKEGKIEGTRRRSGQSTRWRDLLSRQSRS